MIILNITFSKVSLVSGTTSVLIGNVFVKDPSMKYCMLLIVRGVFVDLNCKVGKYYIYLKTEEINSLPYIISN